MIRRFLRWLDSQFGGSNYASRDAHVQANTAAGHYVLGCALVLAMPMAWVLVLYAAKEVFSDLRRAGRGDRTKLRNAALDSVVDFCAVALGTLAGIYPLAVLGVAAIMVAYFVKFERR